MKPTILAACVLMALTGCSSSPTDATAGGAGGPTRFCQIAIDDASPKVDRSNRPKPDAAAAKRRAEEWAASAPDAIKADMAVLVEAASADRSGAAPPQSDLDRWTAATERVLAFVSTECPDGAPYWSCLSQSSFKPVGSTPATGFVKGQAQPGDAVTVEAPEGTTRTELSRTDKLVKFGFVNAAGRLVQTTEVRKGAEGWVQGRTVGCRS